MGLADRAVARALHDLVANERLVLADGASEEALVAAVLARFRTAPASAQLGPYLVEVLIASPLVDELYADNDELKELFNRPLE
jgi:hypothetical protein